MTPKQITIIIASIIIILTAGYFLFRYLKKPVEWTPANSLLPALAPGLADGMDEESLITAIDYSLRYFERKPPGTVSFGNQTVDTEQIVESLLDFKAALGEHGLGEEFFQYIKTNYRFYRSAARRVIFTGYFEADLRGSLTPSEVYRFPLYRKPDDLFRIDLSKFSIYEKHKGLPQILRGRVSENQTIVPYYSRDEIDYQGKLADRDLEMVWIDNPLDVFFLHIQGSGIVELDNGERLRVNYADSNGHPYRSIGRLMFQKKLLPRDQLSMQGMYAYLEEHPEEMREILTHNPSYIFFREVEEGPVGSLGVPVTAYRSIATDRFLFPWGALCYVETLLPEFDEERNIKKWKRHRGFVLNQDTGGAIRTPGRVDFFTGYGEASKLTAGHLKQEGELYFLLKK
jgi:membrane-bound lytic murein transglycosylase A